MKQVMQKAQELADAIVASEVYRKMKDLEEALQMKRPYNQQFYDLAVMLS